MKIVNNFYDKDGNSLLKVNAQGERVTTEEIKVIYAHANVVNKNGLKLNDDSITVTRERYPLHFSHWDFRVEDIVGYIRTDGKPNEDGEFVGYISFYTSTEQGRHAAQVWQDGVIDELSVSYYVDEAEEIDDLNGGTYLNVIKATLKEVSLVSVGADPDTHEVKGDSDEDTEDTDDKTDDKEKEVEKPSDDVDKEDNDLSKNALDDAKLKFFKELVSF